MNMPVVSRRLNTIKYGGLLNGILVLKSKMDKINSSLARRVNLVEYMPFILWALDFIYSTR